MRFAININADRKKRISKDIERKLIEARNGYRFFCRLLKDYQKEKCVLYLNNDLFRIGIRYFDAFFASQTGKRFLIVYENEKQMYEAKRIICSNVQHIVLPQKNIEQMICAYALVDLSGALVVVSLTEPYDTHGGNMLGKKGTTLEEIVCMDIYKLDGVPQFEEKCHA